MRIINKKYLLIILLAGIITSVIVLKPRQEVKLDNVVLKQEVNNKTFAMYTETDNGYTEYEGNSFPEGQRLNKNLSKCVDKNGEEIKDTINVDNETGNISVKSNKSLSCYLYFDNKIEDLSGNENNGVNHAQLWTEEGLTTSIDANNLGYVDCGLANYNFEDSISIILRFKINNNDLDYNSRLISNANAISVNFINIVLNGSRHEEGPNIFTTSWGGEKFLGASNNEVNIGTWYTIVSKINSTEGSIYINGKQIKKSSEVKLQTPTPYPFCLGGICVGNRVINSVMATYSDVLIFDSDLTDEEIQEYFSGEINKEKVLSNYVNNVSDKELLLYYKFD